ncbi:unnamed protein product [Amoebophrya sp. A120]|nr:unnamed protein product [Amoebophrya sp. A120]|eukprot:GSA120T00016635001.1
MLPDTDVSRGPRSNETELRKNIPAHVHSPTTSFAGAGRPLLRPAEMTEVELASLTGDTASSGSTTPSSGAGGSTSAKMRKASRITRNPHGGVKVNENLQRICRSANELIFEQWKNAEGSPISDYAKSGTFEVSALGTSFPLSDIRIWGPRQFQPGFNDEKIRLEFFLDGAFDYNNVDKCKAFTNGLVHCLESALAVGHSELRREEEMTLRQATEIDRMKSGSGASAASETTKTGTESGRSHAASAIKSPVTISSSLDDITAVYSTGTSALNLEVEHYREAGCMIQFVVARCTVNIDAAKLIGEQVFPEYFQTKCARFREDESAPTPLWMYVLYLIVVLFFLLMLAAWRQAFVV